MADNEVATRAPESDAQQTSAPQAEQSVFPGDSQAQTGPSMGVRQVSVHQLFCETNRFRNTVQQIDPRVCIVSQAWN